MRIFFGIALLVLAATPAFARPSTVPAPLLGLGIPALAAAGGAVLGSKVFRRNK